MFDKTSPDLKSLQGDASIKWKNMLFFPVLSLNVQ